MIPIILLVPLGIIFGAGIGYLSAIQIGKIYNVILSRRARKMINGKIDNKYELDGKKQDVNTFIVRDKKDKEVIVKLTS